MSKSDGDRPLTHNEFFKIICELEKRVEARFDIHDARFDSDDARFDSLENRMNGVESGLDSIKNNID